MSLPRLTGLTVDVADHPIAAARLFQALGLNAVVLDDGAEVRCDNGAVVRLMRSRTPTRVGLTFRVRDLCAAATALNDHRTGWTVTAPNVIRLERGDLTVDVTEGEPGLAGVTTYVSDVADSARFYAALGLPVTPIDANPADPDPSEPAAEVRIGSSTLHLLAAGLSPATWAHIMIRVDDPLVAAEGLVRAGCRFDLVDGGAVLARDPSGCGVWVAPPRR